MTTILLHYTSLIISQISQNVKLKSPMYDRIDICLKLHVNNQSISCIVEYLYS